MKHLVAKECLRINTHSSCEQSCFCLQNYHTTVARHCNTNTSTNTNTNNSAKVRTVLCSSNAASCKSSLVGQELLICLFHYLDVCSLGCDSFGTPSILSIAVHSSLLSCLVHSWTATKCTVIKVILPVFNAPAVGLFWNGQQLLCTFGCIFPESWDLVPYGIILRLEKKEEVRGGPIW